MNIYKLDFKFTNMNIYQYTNMNINPKKQLDLNLLLVHQFPIKLFTKWILLLKAR